MTLAIVGMHRSGTSAAAGLLKHCGLFLGESHILMPADQYNQKGYWEHPTFVGLNDRLLASFGGAWDNPPAFPSGWESHANLSGLRSEAGNLIAAMPVDHPWGWKDPRTALTLPFWQALIRRLGVVICVRNPIDVAQSLARRQGMPFGRAVTLWHAYTELSLAATQPERRFVLAYEDLLVDWPTIARSLAEFAGIDSHIDPSTASGFIDAALSHHRHGLDDVLAHPAIPAETKSLYEALVSRRPPVYVPRKARRDFLTGSARTAIPSSIRMAYPGGLIGWALARGQSARG